MLIYLFKYNAQWDIPGCFSLRVGEYTTILPHSDQELVDTHGCIDCHFATYDIDK